MNDIVSDNYQEALIMSSTPQQTVDEQALVAGTKLDPATFSSLYDHYFPRIHKYVLYRISDPQTADDIVSQVFERMLNNYRNYNPNQAPFSAWLFGIARHVVGDHFRRLKRQRWISMDSLRFHTSKEPSSEDMSIQNDLDDRLLTALKCLSDRDKDLISLKFASGLNNRQIAAMTGLSESNVGVILYRAMQRLRLEMVEKEADND